MDTRFMHPDLGKDEFQVRVKLYLGQDHSYQEDLDPHLMDSLIVFLIGAESMGTEDLIKQSSW